MHMNDLHLSLLFTHFIFHVLVEENTIEIYKLVLLGKQVMLLPLED